MAITQYYSRAKTGRRYGSFADKGKSSRIQTITARITQSVTKTQSAIASIVLRNSKTQGATSRISNQVTKTQTCVANIRAIHPVGKFSQYYWPARTGRRYGVLSRTASTSKTQTVAGRVSFPSNPTLAAIARIRGRSSKNQLTLARVTARTLQNLNTVGNISVSGTSTVTQSVVASITSGTHPVSKYTQFYSRQLTGRRYGSFFRGAPSVQTTKTQIVRASIRVTVTRSGSVTLAWDTASGAIGYKIYIGTSSGVYTYTGSPINVGNVTQYQLTLLPTNTYYFAVTAYNTAGESGFSNEIVQYIPAGMYATARILPRSIQNQTTRANIRASSTQLQFSVARIGTTPPSTKTQTATANIKAALTRTFQSVARIGSVAQTTRTQITTANIKGSTNKLQHCTARIRIGGSATIDTTLPLIPVTAISTQLVTDEQYNELSNAVKNVLDQIVLLL